MSSTEQDVIVIGGGFAGLATGALLAHAGQRVLVLERRPVLGGRALVVVQQGFTLNYGLHYIIGGNSSPHYRILKHIGKLNTVKLSPVDAPKLHRMRGGKLYKLPTTPLDMLSTGLLSTAGKLALVKGLAVLMTANPDKLWNVPVGEWIEKHVTREPTLRDFLLDLGSPLTFEAQPELVSAAHFILILRPLLMPKGPLAYYPAGGWLSMFEAYKTHIEQQNGEVRLKTDVDRLEIEGDTVKGVWVDSELFRAKHVVIAVPPGEMIDLLQSTPIQGLEPERLQKIRPTMGVAVDLGVMGLHNDTIGTIELPEYAATLGIHNLFEPTLAPPGGHLMQMLRFLTPEQMQDKANIDSTESMMLKILEQVWPGISAKVVYRRTLVRPIMTAASHRYDQPRPTLLPVQTAVRGLYLAGDATNAPGELSNVAGESALLVADLIL